MSQQITSDHIRSFITNPDLATMDLPFEWKGNPVDHKGRFLNHEYKFKDSFRDLLKWQLMKNPQKEEKKNETWRLGVVQDDKFLSISQDNFLVWLGHSTFFMKLNGKTCLIDPVFFDLSIIRRKVPVPVDPERLTGLDYILISHDHRDHCDEKSIKLLANQNPNAFYLTGLAMGDLIHKFTGSKNIQSAGWYQQYNTSDSIEVYYVPSRHWGRRYLFDTNRRLWGGYVIKSNDKAIYFGGDSGYGSHFKEIQRVFPNLDISIIGIGAYKPEFFMHQSHLSPGDGFKAFKETGAKRMIPMHYGTYDLSDESLGDPIKNLMETEMQSGENSGVIHYLKVGEILNI